MEKEKSDILSKIGKDAGFRVPDNYFEDFAAKMEKQLPEKPVVEAPKNTVWLRVRPYIYLAAMFAGIWCMMRVFNGVKEGETGLKSSIVAGFQNEENVDDFMLHGDVSEYDIMTYEDSVAADEAAANAQASEVK